jgi:hypothetical protein
LHKRVQVTHLNIKAITRPSVWGFVRNTTILNLNDPQVLHDKSTRAGFGKSLKERAAEELLQQLDNHTAKQPSMEDVISLRAVMMRSKVQLDGEASDITASRTQEQSHNRATKGRENGLLPPQDSSAPLIASISAVGNAMPAEIKEEVNPDGTNRLKTLLPNRCIYFVCNLCGCKIK